MGANTKIEWATHTFNPWMGCTKVSPACDHCYAEHLVATRMGKKELWSGQRQRTAASTWKQPRRWNADAARFGVRPRVFCASLADVFDNQVEPEWRRDLFALIHETPNLCWLLLTKRPQNIEKMIRGVHPDAAIWPWPNVWLGTTVENEAEALRRIPHLLEVPAAVRFLSCEPLLGEPEHDWTRGIDWVIAGGESGAKARMSSPRWFAVLQQLCEHRRIPFFFKQWGSWVPEYDQPLRFDQPNTTTYQPLPVNGMGTVRMVRAGKHAGRLLYGKQYDQVPGCDFRIEALRGATA